MHVVRAEQGAAAGFPFTIGGARVDAAPPVGDVS